MQTVFESVMLICFGLSWPISVYKSITSKSTKGKSGIFIMAILLGYIAGIAGKIAGNAVNYVLIIYIFNFIVVSIDFLLFLKNRKSEKNAERKGK